MKKVLALLLAVTMIFTLCACGKMSKEEMLKKAEVADWQKIHAEYDANNARAKETYDDKIILAKDFFVASISDDYISGQQEGIHVSVYLSEEDLLKVSVGDKVNVVGIMHMTGSAYEYNGEANLLDAYIVD